VKRQNPDNSHKPANISLNAIGGNQETINDLLKFMAIPLMHAEVWLRTGVELPHGVLIGGPPGCGKTMLANAIARELRLPLIAVSGSSILSEVAGESEMKLRNHFREAGEKAPCLIFMDEIDAISQKRGHAEQERERRIVAQLLTCMDNLSLEKTGGKPVMIIGATNSPERLDPALQRAARFNKEIWLGLLNEVEREKYHARFLLMF